MENVWSLARGGERRRRHHKEPSGCSPPLQSYGDLIKGSCISHVPEEIHSFEYTCYKHLANMHSLVEGVVPPPLGHSCAVF